VQHICKSPGRHEVRAEFAYDGGGTVTLYVDRKKAGEVSSLV